MNFSSTAKAALVGQMRHDLFETCLLQNNFTKKFAQVEVLRIVRDHADQLIGAGLLNENQVRSEVIRMLPNIQRFVATYTKFTGDINRGGLDGIGNSPNIEFLATSIHGTEEFAVSTEFGIKGFIDATVEASTRPPHGIIDYVKQITPLRSLMGLELKTGHNQTPQHAHMAQLSLYTLALRSRYGTTVSGNPASDDSVQGSATGGMLLYLNQESINAVHVSPAVNEIKSLLSQRNVVAAELRRASAPRGVIIEYDTTGEDLKGEKRYVRVTNHCSRGLNVNSCI